MRDKVKRLLSILMTALMLVNIMPVNAMAEGILSITSNSKQAATVSARDNVYIYTQVTGDTSGLTLNGNGWYTIGVVRNVPNLPTPSSWSYSGYQSSLGSITPAKIANGTYGAVERYSANASIDIADISWSTYGFTVANGATDYASEAPNGTNTWHLDGTVDVKNIPSVYTIKYVDADTNNTLHSEYYEGHLHDPAVDHTAPSTYDKDGYTYSFFVKDGNAQKQTVDYKAETKTLTFYYHRPYTITYQPGAHGTFTKQTYTAFMGAATPAFDGTPTGEAGYTFKGWSPNVSGAVSGDQTYTAQWYENVTLTANSGSEKYNGENQTLRGYTCSKAGVTFSGISAKATGKNVGTYDVTFSKTNGGEVIGTADRTGNYVVTAVNNGKFEITKRDVTITSKSAEKMYDGSELIKHELDVTGDGFVKNEGVTCIYTGTQTQFGSSENTFTWKLRDNTNAGNYNITADNGTLKVTKRDVTLTSASGTKTYDGKPLTKDEVTETGNGFVNGEGVQYDVFGSQTLPGTSSNTFTYKANNGTNLDNYIITKKLGTLTVQPRDKKFEITVKAKDHTQVYTGVEYTTDQFEFENPSMEFTVEGVTYTVEGVSFVPGQSYRNVSDSGTGKLKLQGNAIVKDPDNNDVTDQFTVHLVNGDLNITPRPVTIAAKSAKKVYDGTPLTAHDYTVLTPTETLNEGFLGTEGLHNIVCSGSQTEVGSSDNTIVSYDWNDNTLAENYAIAFEKGKLEVTPVTEEITVTVKGNKLAKAYNGKTQSVEGYTFVRASSPLYTENDFALKPGVEAKASGKNVKRSDTGAAETYDMGLTADSFRNTNTKTFTNVKFVVEEDGKIAIHPRLVRMTSASASKPFDGTPLTKEEVTVDGNGFVEGEGVTYTFSGSQTEVGSSPNYFAFDPKPGTLPQNYVFQKNYGTLAVTASEGEVVVTIKGNSGSKTYNGAEQSWEGYTITNISNPLYKEEYVALKPGVEAKASGTDAGAYFMGLTEESFVNTNKGTFPNVEFYVVDGMLGIDPVEIELTAASKVRRYNGNPLIANDNEYEITKGAFVGEDGLAEVTATGSQTLPGTSASTITGHTLKEGTNARNYGITYQPGKLTVTKPLDGEKHAVVVKAQSGEKTYDGKPLTVSGILVDGVAGDTFTWNDQTFTVKGLTASKEGTNVTDSGAVKVQGTAKIVDAENNDVTEYFKVTTEDGSLTIHSVAIVLTSNSASKVYDGKPLTESGYTITSGAFVAGEGLASITMAGSQTVVGSTFNTITGYKLKSNTNRKNYDIVTKSGILTVTPVTDQITVTIKGKRLAALYSGDEQSVEGYTVAITGSDLYKESGIISFTGTAKASRTHAGITYMGLDPEQFSNANVNFTNVKFVVAEDGMLTIHSRLITMTSADAKKQYDSKPLTAHEVTVTGDGFVKDEGADYTFTGTQTVVGKSENAFTYTRKSNTQKDDYVITKKYGTLEVTHRAEGQEYAITVRANSGSKTYDGTPLAVTGMKIDGFDGLTFTVDGVDETFTLSGLWASEIGTDVIDSTVVRIYGNEKITDSKGNDLSDSFNVRKVDGRLDITPVEIELTANSDTKPYDGQPLTNSGYTITKGAFVGEEGLASVTVEGSQTLVGTSDNVITGHTFKDNTWADNYNVKYAKGTLQVTNRDAEKKYQITVEANSGEKFYDGQKMTVSGFKTLTFEVDGNTYTVSGLTANRSGTNVMDSGAVTVTGTPIVKDAGDNDVTDQFEVSTMSGILRIKPRKVEITSGSTKREYNGTPLTHPFATETPFNAERGEGFIEGEGVICTFTGMQTLVGTSDNEFTYALKEGTKAQNYTIRTEFGTLEVTERAKKYEITVEANSGSKLYDGKPMTVSGFKTLSFRVDGRDYTVEGLTASHTATNCDESRTIVIQGTPIVKDADGNIVTNEFNVHLVNGDLSIIRRQINLRSKKAEKVYDGTPLTCHEIEQTGEFAEGEGVTCTFTGTQTKVGSSLNEFDYTVNEGTDLLNYIITRQFSRLTVKPSTAEVVVTITGNSDSATYDGTEKTVEGYTFTTNNELYTQADFKLVGEAKASGKDADTYPMGLTENSFVNTNSETFPNVRFVVTDGSLTISPIEIELTARSASKTYDGRPLFSAVYDVTKGAFAAGEGLFIVYLRGSQLTPGTSACTITHYKFEDNTKAQNYIITTKDGTLTVISRREDPNAEPYKITVEAYSAEKFYNAATVVVGGFKTLTFTKNVNGKDVTYTVEGITASASATDASDIVVEVKGKPIVKDANGNDVTSEFDVTTVNGRLLIKPRTVTLTSATDSKTYDGTPLTNATVTATAYSAENGTGFAGDEGATYNVTGSQLTPGTSDNTFTYTLNQGTKAKNYTIITKTGTLTVKSRKDNPDAEPYEITVEANSGNKTYDGKEMTVSGFKTLTFGVDGNIYTVEGLTASASATDACDLVVEVKGTPIVKDADGNDVTSEFKVTKVDGSLKITQRRVILASADASKPYDGNPLTAKQVNAAGDGFVDGEGASYDVTGSQTLVGKSANIFTYTLNDNTNPLNYKIWVWQGTLEVTNRTNKYQITLEPNSGEKMYDGTEMTVSGFKTLTFEVEGNTYTVDNLTVSYTVRHVSQSNTFTVSPKDLDAAIVRDKDGNDVTAQFKLFAVDGLAIIKPRKVKLVSKSAEKPYDGTPLTRHEFETQGDGFADGDRVNVTFSGSQTLVGESDNEFTYQRTGTAEDRDYDISTEFGKLKVTDRSDEDKYQITVEANSGNKVYDGTPLTVSGFKTLTFVVDGNTYKVGGLTAEKSVTNVSDSGEVEITGTAIVTDAAGNDVTDQFELTLVSGRADITPRSVTLKSSTASKPYDGDPLIANHVSVEGDGFAAGEDANVSIDVTGSQTLVGTSDNTFTYTLHAGTKAENYNITTEFGKLTVIDRSEENKYPITIEANSDTKVYDGQPLEVEGFKTLTFTANGHDYTVEGLTAFAEAKDFVVDLPVNVQGEAIVRDADGNDVTAQFNITTKNGTLNITKRPASIRSSDAWKEYDGKPLTDHTTASTNFVEGEGAFVSVTGSQTLVGTSDNTFTYTLKDGTKAENYDISTEFGTLEVKNRTEKYKVTVEANSGSKMYDGQPMTVKGFDNLIYVVEDNIYTVSGLKAEKTITNVSESGEVEITGTPVVKDIDGNDVTAQFTVEMKNGNAAITPRKVTLTSDSAEREYNGKPLTNHLVFIEEDGFIDGEGAGYHVTGSQTLVGSSDNTFTYTLHDGTKAENYDITTAFGKLTVTDRSEENKYKITVKGNSGEKKYDGQSMTVSGFETLTFEVEGNTYTVEGLTAEKTGKNVGDSGEVEVTGTPIVKDAGGNDVTAQFNVETKNGTLTINPRLITLTSQPATKEYDGTPLMNPTVVVEEDGFAAGEGATYSNFASQTRVGEKYNSFLYTLNENTFEENYLIQLKLHKLTVTDRTQKFEITVVGNSAHMTYDGTPLTVSGFRTLTFTENGQTFTVEGLSAEKSITNVTESGEVPITGTAVVKDAEGIDVTAQFTVHTVPGTLTITPRVVTMTSATAEKAYDGTPLTHAIVTASAYSAESGTGFVSGEGASYDVTGSQTLVGTSDNTFTYTLNEGTLAANYVLLTKFGKLTVTDGTDEKPLDPSLFLTKTHDATKTYDTGDKVEFTINVTNIYDSEKVVILRELPNVTILGTDTKTLAPNETWTVKAVYTITWEDILRGSFTNMVTAAFKEGKTWSAKDTVEAADLNPVLTVVKTSDINANEKASLGQTINYTITVTNTGNVPATSIAVEDKLTNMTAIIQTLDIGESKTFYTRYTVTEQDVLNGSVLNVATAGGAPIVDPKDPENPKKPEGSGDETVPTTSPITIKPIDKVTLYDGTVQGGTDVELVAGTLLPGHQVHGEILGGGKDADPYQLTVGTATVTDADGNDVTHMYEITRIPGTLLIEKRKVTLTSMSATKEYDGKKLTSTYVTVTGDGFVPGEIANVFGAGGITEVGSITNHIQLVKTAAFNPDNYIITLIEGTLTVTPRTITHKKYDLTIRYVYQDGKTAAPTYHQANMPYGKTYDIASPVIKGYTPSLANVSGMITNQNILITVIYTADSVSVNLSDYGVPLGLGTFTMNVGDCFE